MILKNIRATRFFSSRSPVAFLLREIPSFRSYFRIQKGNSCVILFRRQFIAYAPLAITTEAILVGFSIDQFCYSHISVVAAPFLYGSYCHQQVQTVPSS